MPRTNGVYSFPTSSWYPAVDGVDATVDDYNDQQDDLATAITQSIAVDGSSTVTGDIPMSGQKITGLAAGSANGDAVRYEQLTALLGDNLTAIKALTFADNSIIDLTGAGACAVISYATLKTNLGLSSADSPQFTAIELGAASDTTLARASAGRVSCEGVTLVGTSTTDTLTNKTLTSPTITGGTSTAAVATSGETSGTLTSASANAIVVMSGNVTLNNSVFAATNLTVFDPGTSNRTFTRGAGVTMYMNGTDSASATLAANKLGSAYWRSASVCILSGAFS